jgi:hypothetical protein
MTIFRREPVVVEHTVPPPDIVDTDEATQLEQQARLRHAHRLIDRTLTAQRLLEWDDRNTELVNPVSGPATDAVAVATDDPRAVVMVGALRGGRDVA